MKKRYKTTVFYISPLEFDKENMIHIPYFDLIEFMTRTENLLKNNEYSKEVRKNTINNVKNKFLETAGDLYQCPNGDKSRCKETFPYSDFRYINCIHQKKITTFKVIEIIFIILLLLLLIKVNYNVYQNK